MQFNSLEFGAFYIVVLITFSMIPRKYRYIHLLISSLIFYGWWNAAYLFLMGISIITTYFCGLGIGKTSKPVVKKYL